MIRRNMDDLLLELEELLKEAAIRTEHPKFADLQSYIGTKMQVLGLRSPHMKEMFFQFNATLDAWSPEEQLAFWQHCWEHSEIFEVYSLCLLFVRHKTKKVLPEVLFPVLVAWMDQIDNWAHSDELAHAFAVIYDRLPDKVMHQLRSWNGDANHWKRRQSMVILIRKRRKTERQLPFSEMIALVETLVNDSAYFVQKGVGWALRDIAINYLTEIMAWMHTGHLTLSSVAFSTATERISPAIKENWKASRKKLRSKK